MTSAREPSPVHSAHVGQELEVHYRWHPYFGHKVIVRRAAQRATGRFLSIMGPAGVVVAIADWMLDPVVCAAMPTGMPRVDLAALVELKRLLMCAADTTDSSGDSGIVRENHHDVSQTVVEDALARYGKPEIFNTDQGSQFTGTAFTGTLIKNGIAISMDGKGAWRDNVFVERLWRSVKYEEVYLRAYDTVSEARTSIGRYLDFYNRRRPHSCLDGSTPDHAYFTPLPLRMAA
jgi:Integrase core domain